MKASTVCIDGFNLAMPKGSGISTYGVNLNVALRNLGHKTQILFGPQQGPDSDPLLNEIALLERPAQGDPGQRRRRAILRDLSTLRSAGNCVATPVQLTGEVITRQVARQLPKADGYWLSKDIFHGANRAHAATGRFTPLRFDAQGGATPDVMHWTCPLPLRVPGKPNLYTIHDLIPLRLPYTTLDNKGRFLSLCREICATAERVVTVSEHSKQDIVRILGVDEARVVVTHQSVELPDALTARADEEVAREIEGVFALNWRGYFLFFGAIEPKKNLARIIEAYLASGVTTPLVIIGGKAWLDEDETKMLYDDLIQASVIKEGVLRRSDRIRVYDYLPFSLLVSLIRGAKATLLPSLYEGFGLPVLESMVLRTPVLTSTEGSLPEIAGDAAILVDPYDARAISKAIVALDADADLRDDLTERGVRQAAKFSPAIYQQKLAHLYAALG